MSYIIVLMTTATKKKAENIARSLLNQRRIACANIVGPVSSLLWWREKISREGE